ncbi:sesquipedalian-1 [Spea bombifrons]|uniref:sesquipedalian-1 n=1 Tax=Spea bombifrons TaxID=233779 RepID=UPI00234B892B|nr:sesquipedalian-1 [Spea bombifrons]XP_053313498.1 sesquipedalian-1 [Spea bombifrons]
MKLNERNLLYYATCSSPVDKSGHLLKKGERNTAYHKRWFVLKGNMLFYYESDESKEPVGVIILEGCRVELCDSSVEYAFAIKFEHAKSRAYILAAENQGTMESWVKALTRANFEYLRLVVKELQKQLEEAQKSPKPPRKAMDGTDRKLLNPRSADNCLLDRPAMKDNGCATWNIVKSDLCNGFPQVNGPKGPSTTETPDDVLGDNVLHQPMVHSMEAEDNTDEECASSELRDFKKTISFSKLHALFGKEIVELRAKWEENLQKTTLVHGDTVLT